MAIKPIEKITSPTSANKIRIVLKTLFIALLLILQFVIYALLFVFVREYSIPIYIVLYVIGIVTAIFIFPTKMDAYYKLLWTFVILLAPTMGSILFLIVHNQHDPKKLNDAIQKNHEISKKYLSQSNAYYSLPEGDPFKSLATYTYNAATFPVYDNCDFEFYPLGENFFEGIMREMEKAERFIFLEFFIIKYGYMWPSILELLQKKASQGVEVRVMYDGFNTLFAIPKTYHKLVNSYGIKCKVFSPFTPRATKLQNNRDHRKILVVDGKVAFTGGNNLADEYMNKIERFGHWKDTSIMVRGEAVKSFTMMFLEMWNSQKPEDEDYEKYIYEGDFDIKEGKGLTIPYGYSPISNVQIAEHVYLDIIYNADKYLHIITPYLIPNDKIITALTIAAKRGVDVKLIIPHIPDKKIPFAVARSFYPELLNEGIKIYEYEPGFTHAKEFIADDKICTVGTINLDFRSFFFHFECGLIVYDNDTVLEVERDYEKTLEKCISVDSDYYKSFSLAYRIFGKALRLVGPLF